MLSRRPCVKFQVISTSQKRYGFPLSCPVVSLPLRSHLVVLVPVVELLRTLVLVGVVLVCTLVLDVVLVVHVFGGSLGMTMSLDLVVLVHSLGFSMLVDSHHQRSQREVPWRTGERQACLGIVRGQKRE